MYRLITVAREFGSAGASIARLVADRAGWKLLDRALLEEIARCARVEPRVAERFDECVDPWFHRLGKQALWRGSIEGVAAVTEDDFFDSEAMANFARSVILDAAEAGGCVIVGRGAQCVLAGREDVFHVFVYAPWHDRVRRIAERVADCPDPAALIRETDRRRAAYIRRYFEQDWTDRNLYDMMVNSRVGEGKAVRAILSTAGVV